MQILERCKMIRGHTMVIVFISLAQTNEKVIGIILPKAIFGHYNIM